MLELISKEDAQGKEEGRIIEHHTKYEEIHGEDITIFMSQSKHKILHRRLRREGKCKIPARELSIISSKAHRRTKKYLENHPIVCTTNKKNAGISDWIRKQVRKDAEKKK
jgi:hypothetical protein